MTDDDLESIIVTAGSAYSEGRHQEALELYEKAIAARPTNAILFANKAAILIRLGRHQDGLDSADRAIELDPTWAKAYYRRGEALLRLNSSLDAVVALSTGTALDPANHLIFDTLIEASQQLFNAFPLKRLEAVGLEKDRFTVLTLVGQELASADHPREAAEVLTRALTLCSPSLRLQESALSALASVHYTLGEYQKAALYYEKQLDILSQLDGIPADVHDNIATSAELAGNYLLAVSHRRHRLKYLDGVSAADERLRIARLYCSLSQADAALQECDCVDELMMSVAEQERARIDIGIRIARGIAYSSMGETSKCLEQLTDIHPLNEDDAMRVADSIVACHIKDGNIQNAIEYLNILLKASSESNQQKLFGHTCLLLAREHIRNGRPTSAVRLSKRILRLARTTSDKRLERAGLQLLATIYEEQNDMQSATVLLQKSLEVPGVTILESVNTLLRLSALAEKNGGDAMNHMNKAMKLAENSGNLDVVVLTRSALLRQLITKGPADREPSFSQLLTSQKQFLNADISVTSRSLIFEDLAICETAGTSRIDEIHALEQSLTEAQEGNNVRRELFLLEKLGDCLLGVGRHEDAEGFYQQLLTLAQQLRAVSQIKRAYMKLAILAAGFEKWSLCTELARRALTLSRLFHDNASKTHMMLLIGRAELSQGNNEIAKSIFEKTIKRCEEHGLQETTVLATRYMVDAAIRGKDAYILEHLRHQFSLTEHEKNQKVKLQMMARSARFAADLDHFASLKIVTTVEKFVSAFTEDDQTDILLECFDAYCALGMVDKAQQLLIEILDFSSLFKRSVEKVVERLSVFPLQRRFSAVIKLVERRCYDQKILSQLAYFLPKFTLNLIFDERMEDWDRASACAEMALSGRLPSRFLDGLFGKLTAEEAILQVLLVAKWRASRSLLLSDFSTLDDTTFCRLFDEAYTKILHDEFIIKPRSKAHLHALMLHGEFDITHEAAGSIEKIICAANTGCDEMISMWYDELVEDFLNEPTQGIDVFPYSSKEFELKVATVFFALQHEEFSEQLHVFEMCKWFMDKRLAQIHGLSMEPLALLPPPYNQPFAYVFRVEKVELIWATLHGNRETISFTLREGTLTFLEECMKRYLLWRGIPEIPLDMSQIAVLFVNHSSDVPVNPKVYNCHDSLNFSVQRNHEEWCSVAHNNQNGEDSTLFSKKLSTFSRSSIAIVDPQDRLLHPDICFSIGKTPNILITLGSLPFITIRALFFCGTAIVIELDEAAQDKDVKRLIASVNDANDKISHGSDIMEVLCRYQSYVKSSAACHLWNTSGNGLSRAGLGNISDFRGVPEMRVIATELSPPANVSNSMSDFIADTHHCNLWLRPPVLRSSNTPTHDLFQTDMGGTLLATCRSLLDYKNDLMSASSPEKKLNKTDTNRSKRRKKKPRNRSIYGSNGADGCQSDSVCVRPLSDVLSQSSSSAICSAVE